MALTLYFSSEEEDEHNKTIESVKDSCKVIRSRKPLLSGDYKKVLNKLEEEDRIEYTMCGGNILGIKQRIRHMASTEEDKNIMLEIEKAV